MSGFQSPNFTQTPNDFFDMLPDMAESELKVTLVMIRNTFGFHRDGFKMGLGKIAKAAGLSRNGAKAGAEAAEKRGTFRRVNPESLKEAEWELVVDTPQPVTPSTVDPSTSDHLTPQPVTTPPSTSEGQSRVKERIKKRKKGDAIDGYLFFGKQAKEQQVDKVEEIVTKLETGLRLNFPRGTKDQSVYRRILDTGKPIEQFIQWVASDERRMSFAFLYAKDTSSIWRDFPQAFPVTAEAVEERRGGFYG